MLVKNRRFEPTPPLFAPPYGVTPLEFRRYFWYQKSRVHGRSYGVVCVIHRLAVLLQCRFGTDRPRDRHDHSKYRASIASRGKNPIEWSQMKIAFKKKCYILFWGTAYWKQFFPQTMAHTRKKILQMHLLIIGRLQNVASDISPISATHSLK